MTEQEKFSQMYPTLAKIDSIQKKWMPIKGFLEHLDDMGYTITTPEGEELHTFEKLLHEYFGVDYDQAERERVRLLENL